LSESPEIGKEKIVFLLLKYNLTKAIA